MSTTAVSSLPNFEEIRRLSQEFETAEPEDIMRWAVETYRGQIVSLSSFGASSGAILHMLAQIDDSVPVVFLQTHYHFEETLQLRDDIAEKYNLTVENWEARGGRPTFLRNYPDDLNTYDNLKGVEIPEAAKDAQLATGVDLCCWLNKVEPMQRALKKRAAYITSIRRDGGTEFRQRTKILEFYERPNSETPLVKVNPMANWDKKQLWKYIHKNGIPVHDLWQYGYKSIGCQPCTKPVGEGGDEREGRWGGSKDECGIHTVAKPVDYSI